jgi:hypothetical protein
MPVATVYFISETAPVNTHASSVVFYRHLQKLSEEGYRVVWVTDNNTYQANRNKAEQWELVVLPNRRWHLPPYRAKGLAQHYRFAYYYRKYLQARIKDGPAVLLTHLSGQFLAPFAAFVNKRTQIPLISFFHDDILELNFHRNEKRLIQNTEKVLEASFVVLTVSAAFGRNWPKYAAKFRILYPLPEVYQGPTGVKKQKEIMTIGYSGAVYEEIIPCFEQVLQQLNGKKNKLLIIGDLQKTRFLRERFPEVLTCIALFDTPAEAAQFLVEHCDAMIIPYPAEINKMPWIATCYPSKFLQYCQLGLPTMIIAPAASAIGNWCIDHQWLLYSPDYGAASLDELLHHMTSKFVLEQITNLNTSEFNPERIHEQLSNTLRTVLKLQS